MPGARAGPVSAAGAAPRTAARSSAPTPPLRSRRGAAGSLRSTIVDSTPTAHGPPSRTRSTSSPRLARTCAARRRARPRRSGSRSAPRCRRRTPAAARARAAGRARAGPTVSRPPVTASGTPGARRRTSVSGPGQKRVGERRAPRGGTSAAHAGRSSARREVHDHRVVGGPALHGEEARERRRVARVGAEAVDRLGRERDEPARAQDRGGALDVLVAGIVHRGAAYRQRGSRHISHTRGPRGRSSSSRTRKPCRA